MKRHKDPVNTPIEHDDAQVFVLPPDLLEKLGIQLLNISCPPGGPEESSILDQAANHNAKNTQCTEAPSILETANLMKKSLFMSPTFVSTTASETISELPNVTENEELIQDVTVLQKFEVNDVLDTDTTAKTVFDNSDINPYVTQQVEDLKINQSSKEIENSDLFLNNVSYESSNGANIDLNSCNKTSTSVDEAYSLDGSNCNSGTVSEIINNNLKTALKQQKQCSKIKILSEQIINHSDLNTIPNSRTKKSSCFLIPVNTIVTGKVIKEHFNNELGQETAQEELCTPEINREVKNKFGKMDLTNHILESITTKDTIMEDLLSDTYPRTIEPGVINEETNHNVKTDHKSNNKGEMGLNTDKQIPNDNDRKNNYLRKFCKDENVEEKVMNDFTKEMISNTKKNSGKPKLCIQGVEKPGGICEKNIVLKTYQRTNIRRRIPEFPHVDRSNTMDSNILPNNVIDLNKIYIGGYKYFSKFCVCSDFGQLEHYDRDTAYEHLHFCDHSSVSCNVETLFSMYDDTSGMCELNITEDIDEVNEDVEIIQHGICWLSFACENNDDTIEFDIFEPEISEELNSIPCQPRRSNRKRKSTASEHVTEIIEPKSKKPVKCGACGLILSEAEWNKHKDSEHNLIAWKDGQTIVKYISTTTDSNTLPDDASKKKDATPTQTKSTRRTSRNFNLESNVSKISSKNTTKSEINNDVDGSSSKQILKSTSIETDIQCGLHSSKSSTILQNKTPLPTKIMSIETSSDSKCTKKSIDKDAPEPYTKGLDDPTKLKNMSIDVISHSKPIAKSLDVKRSARCTRQSNTYKGISKSTDEEGTPKPTKTSFGVSSKSTEIEDNLKSKAFSETTKRTSDGFQKATQLKDTPKTYVNLYAKSSRISVDDTSRATEIKNLKPEAKVISKITKVKSPKSINIPVGVRTISSTVDEKIDAIYSIPTPEPKEYVELCNDATTKSMSMIDTSNNSTKRINKIDTAVSTTKSTLKPKVDTPQTSNNLKQIDLFSTPTSRKNANISSQPKSMKKSKDEKTKPVNVETTPMSMSRDISSKRTKKTMEVENSNKLIRKSLDAETSFNNTTKPRGDEVDASSTFVVGISATSSESSQTPRKYTRKVVENLKLTKKSQDTNLKSQIKYQSLESHKKSSDITKSETISTNTNKDVTLKSRKNANIVSIEVPPEELPHRPFSVEIEIPAHNANTQKVVNKFLCSNSKNNFAQSIKKSITSENSNNPQAVEDFAVSIKKETLPQCGVCKQQVEESLWIEHIANDHNYLAWREDEPPLDLQNDEEVRAHLYAIAKANGGLKCSKCHIIRKYVKSYLAHIQSCDGNEEEQNQMDESTTSMDTTLDLDDVPLNSYPRGITAAVVCGVCSETVLESKWIDHIRLEHNYLAWKRGEPPLDLKDEVAVKSFLKNISNYHGGLICSKCGIVRTYVKSWMAHESTCKGPAADESLDSILNNSKSKRPEYIEIEITSETVKCGKCSLEMPSNTWINHIEREHYYLSWIEGQPPLEESNPDAVSAYLHNMVKKHGVLNCVKCGVARRYPKAFLTHISACEISGFKREDYFVEVSEKVKPGEYECAICHEIGNLKDWKKHAMDKHYNVAWMAGNAPINLKNPYAVEKYMKEYRAKHNLICKVCGASRASCYGFYAHIMTCGKSEEELEHLMEMCDICNNKFLCIYRNQHKAMHKEQMIKKEKKEQAAIKAEEEQKNKAAVEEGEPTGKRRAAEKAKKVMEKYNSNILDGSHACHSCHIEFDTASQLKGHKCQGSKLQDGSDSDVSMKMEGQEESDDDMEDVDSNISDEEEDPMKRKRQPETIPKIILPFKVKDFNYYLAKSFENFREMHYTNECLFKNWRRNDYRIIAEDEYERYLPVLSESCKVRAVDSEWETFKRFEARRKKDMIIFTGATIRCMQWVPHPTTEEVQDHYLSVSCFRDADCPRYGKDELPQHPGMLQIWNMGQLLSTPKLAIGLAHDFGTIWAMDWCPSGARDTDSSEDREGEGETGCGRLGLIAIACSNGCAYILSVPSFKEIEDKPIICKLKPVAELRLSMKPIQAPFRMGYQATSISWSPQKGHDVVMVGYADGTTALYDVNTQSTLLKETENGVDIFYPFQDALAENSTITGTALCASADLHRVVGGVASASVTGATMAGWPRQPIVRSHLAASSITYMPNWPAALLCSDDLLTMKSTNEMEWWGGGRRLGGACAAAACARCGRVAVTAPPFVRVLRAHPVYPELKKQIVATVKMVPFARKRKLKNDDLAMIVEPLTYDEAVKKYGLEFKALPKKDRNVASKLYDNVEQCAERFPLSDMPAAAFCPSTEHHNRLAIATHAGFIFIISI